MFPSFHYLRSKDFTIDPNTTPQYLPFAGPKLLYRGAIAFVRVCNRVDLNLRASLLRKSDSLRHTSVVKWTAHELLLFSCGGGLTPFQSTQQIADRFSPCTSFRGTAELPFALKMCFVLVFSLVFKGLDHCWISV